MHGHTHIRLPVKMPLSWYELLSQEITAVCLSIRRGALTSQHLRVLIELDWLKCNSRNSQVTTSMFTVKHSNTQTDTQTHAHTHRRTRHTLTHVHRHTHTHIYKSWEQGRMWHEPSIFCHFLPNLSSEVPKPDRAQTAFLSDSSRTITPIPVSKTASFLTPTSLRPQENKGWIMKWIIFSRFHEPQEGLVQKGRRLNSI